MTLTRRIYLQQVLLVTVVAGVASYAAALPQAPVASSAAPSVDATKPVPSQNAPAASNPATRQQQQSLQNLYNQLLVDGVGGGSSAESVLVVPGKPMDPQAIDQAVEDLSVMSRIIEKNALEEYRIPDNLLGPWPATRPIGPWATGGPATLFSTIGQAKPMYLGGYGALFFIQVYYPLLPPPQAPKEQPANPQEDPVWAEARRSVFEPQARPAVPQEAEPVEPYSREQVDTLRSELIATLKHATNIRVLEPTEWIAIVVQGAAPAALPVAAPTAGRTVLTLRATKADVDQYAKGQLDQAQFAQRVQIVTY